ncbi:MAG: hypothetical protein J5J00_11690, partial [Deltaproteobacteria bacterium]|nr:hypothetical protein [Deltaproteobacteria bacterium]
MESIKHLIFGIIRFSFLMAVAVAVTASKQAAAEVLIDDFTGDKGTTASLLFGGTNPNFESLIAPSAIGGVRAYKAFVDEGSDVTARTLQGRYTHSTDDLSLGSTMITWDGDTNASNIDFDGLGGISLEPGPDRGFRITIVSFDNAFGRTADVIFTVYDASSATGQKFSRGKLTLDQPYLNKKVVLPFSALTTAGPGGSADLNNVGAITMEVVNGLDVNGLPAYSIDLSLDMIEAGCINLDPQGVSLCPTAT